MSFPTIPTTLTGLNVTDWQTFAPIFTSLRERPLSPDTLPQWLADWSQLAALLDEAFTVIYVDKSIDTTDPAKEQAFLDFINLVYPQAQVATQALKERLLALDFLDAALATDALANMDRVVHNMRNAAALFRPDNVPLQTQLAELVNDYEKVTGGLKAIWNGEEKNISQLYQLLQEKDRDVREKAWRVQMALWQSERETFNQQYTAMLQLRQQLATNAGLADYREYAFREHERFDYTPQDCAQFHEAIEQVVVPAAARIYQRKKERLGLDRLRPWDVYVDTSDAPPLQPYQGQDALIAGSLQILNRVDDELGHHFGVMADEGLLDLDTRPGKALGGFCSTMPLRQRPFIFMNGVGMQGDVQTLLHEAGHAFHVFESVHFPFVWQLEAPMEFCEVASMAMELLASPYLTQEQGGFYTPEEAARARIEHLEDLITFWPYMAVVDAFQHWVYTHPEAALDSANCDAQWDSLWQRFMVGIDWDGLDDARVTGWHRKNHIFTVPFYYIEYGIAQMGAVQIWRNSLQDQAAAVAAYRQGLSLGGTRPLPELFAAAGAEFRFDAPLLAELVALVENKIKELEARL